MSVQIEALDLSQYNPRMTMIIVNVYTGKMSPSKVKPFLETYKENLAPFFKDRGFEVIFVPVTFDMAQAGWKGTVIDPEPKAAPAANDEKFDLEYFFPQETPEQCMKAKDAKDAVYDPTSQVEDFIFPNDSDGKGSKVETLEGSEEKHLSRNFVEERFLRADPANRNPCHPYKSTQTPAPSNPFKNGKVIL